MCFGLALVVDEVPLPIYPCKPLQTLTHPSLLTTLPHNPSYNLALYIILPQPLPTHHFLTTLPYSLAYTLLNPNTIPLPFIKPLLYPNAIPLPFIKPLHYPNASLFVTPKPCLLPMLPYPYTLA